MRTFNIAGEHHIDEQPATIVEDLFGTVRTDDEQLVVDDPHQEAINSIRVRIEHDTVYLEIDEVTVDNRPCDEAVERAVKARNELLRRLTGKTVEDRKREMRHSVLPDSDLIRAEPVPDLTPQVVR